VGKFESWEAAKDFQREKGDTPDSSRDFARAGHQAANDYQDSGSPFGPLSDRDRSSKSDIPSREPNDAGGSNSDIPSREPNDAGGSSGPCFVTTACAEIMGLADDCNELMVLRHFRDSYLLKEADGRKAVELYYQVAPRILAAVRQSSAPEQALRYIYQEWIMPSVQMVEAGRRDKAFEHYRNGMAQLAKRYKISLDQ